MGKTSWGLLKLRGSDGSATYRDGLPKDDKKNVRMETNWKPTDRKTKNKMAA
jgi:hypothetical protein